jgi:hypothetical protein
MVLVSEWLSNVNPCFFVAHPIVSVCAKTLPDPLNADAGFRSHRTSSLPGVNRIVGRASMSGAEGMGRTADDQSAT